MVLPDGSFVVANETENADLFRPVRGGDGNSPGPPFPEELHMKNLCGIVWSITGTPVFDAMGPAPFPAAQGFFDPLFPAGTQWWRKADNFTELTDEAIERHLEHGSKLPTLLSTMHLCPLTGARAGWAAMIRLTASGRRCILIRRAGPVSTS